jgi:membrane-anchored glycerophosphoryl diester phosphodiesterase (GDPDase)
MAPAIGKAAFTIGVAILIMALFALFYVEPDSPEFVVAILALALVIAFLGLLIWSVRRAARLPTHRPPEHQEPTPVKRGRMTNDQ